MGVVTLLSYLLRQPSFTPTDFIKTPEGKEQQAKNYAACAATLDILETAAGNIGFEVLHRPVFENLHPEFPYPVENLVLRLRKGNPARSLCFLGHTDVVGVNPKDWSVDPFGAAIHDGYLYGRGATDMKGGVAAWFTAVRNVVDELDDVDIYIVITTDEESMALNGTRPTLEWMHANGHKPTAFIVGEPSAGDVLGDSVRPGRRGCMGGRIVVTGVGGHTAYPGTFVNPSDILLDVLQTLKGIEYAHPEDWSDSAITNFETTGIKFSHLMNINVVEATAEAAFNLRFTGNYSPEDLEIIMQQALDDAGFSHEQVKLNARVDLAARPYNSKQGRLSAAIRKAIALVAPGVTPDFNRRGGTSDGRFVQEFDPDAEVIEFGSPYNGGVEKSHPDYGKKGGLHMADERIKLTDLHNLTRAYAQVITDFFTGA